MGAFQINLNFEYNLLHLLHNVREGGTIIAGYEYGYGGVKLKVWDSDGNGYAYMGNLVYRVTGSSFVFESGLFGEGVVSGSSICYHLKDHLGSIRAIIDGSGRLLEENDYYAFGQRYPRSEQAQSSANRFKYNGKELQTVGGLGYLDYGARMYDQSLGRWFTTDPLSEKYYGLSPYVYCGNNPLRYVDPDGKEWKEKKDEEIAKQLQQQIASRDKSLAKQETSINAKIEKIENNTKLSVEKKTQRIAKQQGKLENIQFQRTLLSNLDNGITQLGNSKTSYTFNTVEAGTTATLSSMSDGTIIINNYGMTGNRAHETTHAIQHDNGKITFNPLGTNNALMQNPMGLEIQAYATEYSITNGVVPSSDVKHPRTVFGINLQWLYGLKDRNTGIYIYRPENYK